MDRRPVGLRPPRLDLGQRRRGRVEPRLQRLIGQVLGQRPADAGRPRPPQAVARPPWRSMPRLAAILRFDMPAAVSRSTSRILRMGNLCSGIPRSLLQRERGHADSRITQRCPSRPSTAWSRSPGTGGRDQSERLVAIDRNGGRHHPVRAPIRRCVLSVVARSSFQSFVWGCTEPDGHGCAKN